ncbi:sulfatase [Echinimonas agarilytica]|uniref:Sulfatase n=1 Tax=Echinimonas agarilytica TaxID=1215918 RepID=A0AA41W5R5_9GAMM|nr:sulfatase [Echinimonas agarilytica]MCM2679377.1 sulfatase [Echinimonas agarilytica]
MKFTNRFFQAFLLCLWLFATTASAKGPNILVIMTDDQNDWSFYGDQSPIKTPNLDLLKQQSVVFNHAYTASPVCGPSRTAFFSGLYPHTTGGYYNKADFWRKKGPLENIETMTELFMRNGYMTYGHGKLYHSKMTKERNKKNWSNKTSGGGFGPWPKKSNYIQTAKQKGNKFFSVEEWDGPDSDFPDIRNADKMREFLSQQHDKPFFAVYGLWRPHSPYTAPRRFFDMYDPESIQFPAGYKADDLDDIPAAGQVFSKIWKGRWDLGGDKQKANWRRVLHGYYACTSFADWNVGQVMKALDKGPNAKDTIVLFWSDNGYHLGEKHHYEKATVWEQAARVPLAIRLPDGLNAGKVVQQPVVNVDFYPTLVELAGLEMPANPIDGKSMVELLKDPNARWDRPAISSYGSGVVSVRDIRFRYIQYPDGSEELYDHDNDPHEWTNLANKPDYDKVKERLKRSLPTKWYPSLGGRFNEGAIQKQQFH